MNTISVRQHQSGEDGEDLDGESPKVGFNLVAQDDMVQEMVKCTYHERRATSLRWGMTNQCSDF